MRSLNQPSIIEDLVSLPEVVNSLFENSFLSPTWSRSVSSQQHQAMPLNIYEDAQNFYLLALVPGIDPDKIDLTVKEKTLVISGQYSFNNWPVVNLSSEKTGDKDDSKTNRPQYRTLVNEISQGQFYRQVTLPSNFAFDKIEALSENGLLKLVIPKAEQSQVKRIQVRPGNQRIGEGLKDNSQMLKSANN